MVEVVAREAERAVTELVEWGCCLARTAEGALDQRFFGAHRWRRTCYAGDWTGRAMMTALGARARTETRGCHSRQDFPALDPALQVTS